LKIARAQWRRNAGERARLDSADPQSHCAASIVNDMADKILIRRADSQNREARCAKPCAQNFLSSTRRKRPSHMIFQGPVRALWLSLYWRGYFTARIST
jgi:hypothetical protein